MALQQVGSNPQILPVSKRNQVCECQDSCRDAAVMLSQNTYDSTASNMAAHVQLTLDSQICIIVTVLMCKGSDLAQRLN